MAVDWFAGLIALTAVCLWVFFQRIRRRQTKPAVSFSEVDALKGMEGSWKTRYHELPFWLLSGSFFLFLLAFTNPVIKYQQIKQENPSEQKSVPPIEGAAIYLLLDQSGSMAEQVVKEASPNDVSFPTKIQELRSVTKLFIEGDPTIGLQGRPNDLIGIVAFARVPQVLSPLTLDKRTLLQALDKLDVVKDHVLDGTAMGYAIYKTANIIAATKQFANQLPPDQQAAYHIRDAIIILVTDGFPSPNPEDKGQRLRNIGVEEAAQYAKKEGIHLYVITVDPTINEEELAPQRRLMERITGLTGGKYYPLDDMEKLATIYAQIDKLEKSSLPIEVEQKTGPQIHIEKKLSLYPYLIACALLMMGASILFETTKLKMAP